MSEEKKLRVLLDPDTARTLKRLAAQAVETLTSAEDNPDVSEEEKGQLVAHRDNMQTIVDAVGAAQRIYANKTL